MMQRTRPGRETRNPAERLLKEIRDTAYESARTLWGELLDAAENVNMLWGMARGLKQLIAVKDHLGALDVLRVMYCLTDEELPEQIDTYAEYYSLLDMFLDEFMTETEELLMDWELHTATKFMDDLNQAER